MGLEVCYRSDTADWWIRSHSLVFENFDPHVAELSVNSRFITRSIHCLDEAKLDSVLNPG